jgi:hypothetical protein
MRRSSLPHAAREAKRRQATQRRQRAVEAAAAQAVSAVATAAPVVGSAAWERSWRARCREELASDRHARSADVQRVQAEARRPRSAATVARRALRRSALVRAQQQQQQQQRWRRPRRQQRGRPWSAPPSPLPAAAEGGEHPEAPETVKPGTYVLLRDVVPHDGADPTSSELMSAFVLRAGSRVSVVGSAQTAVAPDASVQARALGLRLHVETTVCNGWISALLPAGRVVKVHTGRLEDRAEAAEEGGGLELLDGKASSGVSATARAQSSDGVGGVAVAVSGPRDGSGHGHHGGGDHGHGHHGGWRRRRQRRRNSMGATVTRAVGPADSSMAAAAAAEEEEEEAFGVRRGAAGRPRPRPQSALGARVGAALVDMVGEV